MLPNSLKCIDIDVPSNMLCINGVPMTGCRSFSVDMNADERYYRLTVYKDGYIHVGEYDLENKNMVHHNRMRWEDV